ncbi:hypothetical protein [Streptomyces sp. NPDC097640]
MADGSFPSPPLPSTGAAFALAACQDDATANDAAPSAITVDAVGGGK